MLANSKNILITGVSGLIGGAIAEQLAGEYQIIGLDLKPPKEELKNSVSFYKTDLTDETSIKRALKEIAQNHGDSFASIIHLAAYYDFSGEPSDMYEKLTVNGTRHLVRSLKSLDFTVEQFLFSSTHLVMKPVEKGLLIKESDEMRADWDYPRSKIEAEGVINQEIGDIKSVILRISGVYDGQGHSPPICNQIQRIYEKQFTSHFYPGDQEKGQPFVHLEDVVSFIARVVEKRVDLAPREVFFVAEPELLSYGELQDRIGQLIHGREWKTFFTPKSMAKAGAWVMNKQEDSNFIKPWMIDLTEAHYPLSQANAQQKLGWSAKHRLYEELPGMIDFLKKDPASFYKMNKLGEPPRKRESEERPRA